MDTVEERLARLERDQGNQAKTIEQHGHALYGEDNDGGLVREFRDLRTENRYLRIIYILGTALFLPWLNALLGKVGLGPIRLGGS